MPKWFPSLIARLLISVVALSPFVLRNLDVVEIGIVDNIENYLYDLRLNVTMPEGVDPRVVILDIDETSIAKEGQWPWSRDKLGLLVNQLFDQYNIRALGWDVVFAEADDSTAWELLQELAESPWAQNPEFSSWVSDKSFEWETDYVFAETLLARPIVLGYVFKDRVDEGTQATSGQLPPPNITAAQLEGIDIDFPKPEGYTGSLPLLADVADNGGFFDSPLPDPDGILRRVPLLQEYEGNVYQSLALGLARAATGNPNILLDFAPGVAQNSLSLEALIIGDLSVPVDQNAAMRVPYRGKQGSFPYVSATDVINGSADPSVLADRIVLVGTSAPGLLDLRVTPVDRKYAGVEVHANLVAGLLDSSAPSKPGWIEGVELVWLGLIALLLVIFLPRVGPLTAFSLLVVMIAGNIGASFWFWADQSLVVPFASPVLYATLQFLLQMSYGFAIESRRKNRLSKVFGQYIPPELVSGLDASDEALSLEGESREMTVLFSDVRGFTTISEGLPPQELTQLMNEFLTPITRIIHEHKGTIDKYMGDAVMAFWGAPLNDPDHARHALEAGLAMGVEMQTLSAEFKKKGWPEIKIGVGLNTGSMNVGNMGSEFRMAYTVLGDAVNLGSRLESLTKQYGVEMMVSEYTAAEVTDFSFRELDLVRVKGKDEPVRIFEPIGKSDALPVEDQQRLVRWNAALASFRQQKWAEASALLQELSDEEPQRMIYRIYLERIEHFVDQPPEADWDGVFTHTSK